MTQEKVAMCDSGAGNGPVLPCTPPVEYSCAQNKRLPQGPSCGVQVPPPLEQETPCTLERDYYGCYCLKFIVKNGTHITEDKVMEDFGKYGEVVDVRGPGLFSGLRGNHVYVRFIDRLDAEDALKNLLQKYHQLTPASISDVLPDNYGLYTISFYNKTGIPSSEVRREFSKFGEVKNLTGSLDVKGGRVFVSYKNKNSAVEALQAFFFRKDRYPNMKFALPRCEKDYFGCYCLKFYNKSGDVTEEKVLEDFGQYGEVVDVRGPGLFDVTGDDVYVRYKEKSSAEQALIELVGKYDSLCLAPPSDIQADKFGYYTITFVNDKCLSKSDVWYIFSKFGTVACVNGTFDCKKGRVFVSYKEKQGALNALETMLITKEYHLQVSKNSTVRKNDYNIVSNPKENDGMDFEQQQPSRNERALSEHKTTRDRSCSREASCGPASHKLSGPPPALPRSGASHNNIEISSDNPPLTHNGPPPPILSKFPMVNMSPKNGLVKFNRNVEKDIFGYYCLSFLNEDGEISEKNVRHVFSKFGEVVSVRGALGKQKGHVFVRFRKKEAAENCLNCLNSFPLSEMSELFGRYLFLSPATPRDIDCDMYGLYSISFLNLNAKSFREIRQEFSKFGEIVRQTTGGGSNTDELVTISYNDKGAAVRALQTHFTNKDYPYLDIAKGSSLLLVNSSDSSDCEDHESSILAAVRAGALHPHHKDLLQDQASRPHSSDRLAHNSVLAAGQHDPFSRGPAPPGSDVVDELLKPLQSYFSVFRTGQYTGGGLDEMVNGGPPAHNTRSQADKRYKIKKQQEERGKKRAERNEIVENGHMAPHGHHPGMAMVNIPMGAPPPLTNGFHHPRMDMDADMSHLPPPNMAEPPPNMVPVPGGAHQYPPPAHHLQHPLLMPPPVLLSSSPNSSSAPILYTNAHAQVHPQVEIETSEQTLDLDISKMSISEMPPPSASVHSVNEEPSEQEDTSPEPQVDLEQTAELLTKDLFNLYSLSFSCKSKDLSERRIKLDFGLVAEVSRIRGQLGRADSNIIVSFENKDDCLKCIQDKTLISKYPTLAPAPVQKIVADKDGYFSIEFTNVGMSGVREITNEFSKHGEIVKVQQSGGRNSVKKVTVSYQELDAAVTAIQNYANSNDVRGIDFVTECLEHDTGDT